MNTVTGKPHVLENPTGTVNENGNIILLSKHSTLAPQLKQISKQGLVMMDTAKKKDKPKELLSIRAPPPPAVARRNARERNRVKQVNNGFANLRQHIPSSIAAAYESGRSGNKKLSKVETLRMAVDYIRSLEDLLSLDDTNPSSNSNMQSSSSNYATSLASPSSDDDNISSNSTPPPPLLQYIKVDGSETYHLLPIHMLENNDHLKSLKIEHDLKPEVVNFRNINRNSTNPISPGIYSENSLSPGTETDIQSFIPFHIEDLSSSPPTIKIEETSETTEDMRILCHNLIMLQADNEEHLGKQQLSVNELISW